MGETLTYEIREVRDPEGGLKLELTIEGNRVATASARSDVLQDMEQLLGLERKEITQTLHDALRSFAKQQLAKVTISDPVEDSDKKLLFRSNYVYREFDRISPGLVWYNVQTGETGPSDLPAMVRNQMRQEVHRKLTAEGSHARALVEL